MRVVISALSVAVGSGLQAQRNPIGRVTSLLEDLAKKMDFDAKEEQKIYNKFECWCQTVQKSKAETIAAASERITELENYIDELDSGRVELTDERDTFEAEIESMKKDIKNLDDTRTADHDAYEKNEAETDDAITALGFAISKLQSAASGHTDGVFFELSQGMVHMIRKADLSEQDSQFLDEVLSEDPDATGANWDQKKLAKKGSFRMGYKARSQKILKILEDMKTQFESDHKQMIANEEEAVADYTRLRASREAELNTAVNAKNSGAEEAAARNKAKQKAQDEADELTDANNKDEQFVSETQATCAAKETEFELRKEARKEEVASIREAISILRADDARDTFKASTSLNSFVQLDADKPKRLALAVTKIRSMAGASLRLQALAASLAAAAARTGGFETVLGTLDKQIENLHAEQDQDLKMKLDCETDRADAATNAKDYSKKIDRANGHIEEYRADNTRLQGEIKGVEDEIAALQTEKQQATLQRASENAEYLVTKADNEQAASLVQQAHDVIKAKKDQLAATANGPELLQVRASPGGVAPTPPPETFGGTYTGAKGETNGILAIMKTVKDQILKDQAKADAEEAEAVAAFASMVTKVTEAITEKEAAIGTMESSIADNDGDISDQQTVVTNTQGTLQGTLDLIKQLTPQCDFIAANFDIRTKDRDVEIDGLRQAKDILSGASA
jgi:hypothetical protein